MPKNEMELVTQEGKPEKKEKKIKKEHQAFYLQEYSALRGEILKRMDIRHQLFTFTMVATGTILSVGLAAESTYKILFAYPLVALFVAGSWMNSDYRIYQIGQYIMKNIEERLLPPDEGWEHAHKALQTFSLVNSIRGIIFGTQFLVILVALLILDFKPDLVDSILLGIDALAVIFTIFTMRIRG